LSKVRKSFCCQQNDPNNKNLFQRISSQVMMQGLEYTDAVKQYYSFLETELGFHKMTETINGNAFYDVEYKDETRIISISYENIEDYLETIIFLLQNGKKPDYDDKTKTLHLKRLNQLTLPKASQEEINLNAGYFYGYAPKTVIEKKLLKEAKELRFCLTHFDDVKKKQHS
jgi:hypothetical protein